MNRKPAATKEVNKNKDDAASSACQARTHSRQQEGPETSVRSSILKRHWHIKGKRDKQSQDCHFDAATAVVNDGTIYENDADFARREQDEENLQIAMEKSSEFDQRGGEERGLHPAIHPDDPTCQQRDREQRIHPSGLECQELRPAMAPGAYREGGGLHDDDSAIMLPTTTANATPYEEQQQEEESSRSASLVQARMVEEPEQEIPLAAAKPLVESVFQNCWARRQNRYMVMAVLAFLVTAVVVALVVAFLTGGGNEPSTAPPNPKTPPDWVQVGQILVGEGAGDLSGTSVSLAANGSVLAIGAPSNDGNGLGAGHVRVWQRTGGIWIQLGNDIEGISPGDGFGYSVSLSAEGSVLAVGAPWWKSITGQVRVWRLVNGTWTQLGQSIDGISVHHRAGSSVSLSADGGTLAIGTPGNFEFAASVWQWTSGNWTQLGQEIPSASYSGSPNQFVSLSANPNRTFLAVGAPRNSGNDYLLGAVRVWQWTEGSQWEPLGQDVDGNEIDESGSSVALSSVDGTVLAIGAPRAGENETFLGHVRVWRLMGGMNGGANWTQLGQDIDGEDENDYFGRSVALSANGSFLAIGAAPDDYFWSTGAEASGYVRVFQWMENEWVQFGSRLEGKDEYDEFGTTVTLSADGHCLAVGAIQYDEARNRTGYVQVFQLE